MAWQSTVYLLPLLFAGVTSAGVAAYGTHVLRRDGWRPQLVAFVVMNVALTEWVFLYAVQVANTELETKLIAFKLLHVGSVVVPLAWFAFALAYTGREQWLTPRRLVGLSLVPLTLLVTLPTNPGSLAISNAQLVSEAGITFLDATTGPIYMLFVAYSYVLLLVGSYFLVRSALHQNRTFRGSAALLLIGVLVPLIVSLVETLVTIPLDELVYLPVSLSVSGFVFGVAVFRYQIYDIRPIARNTTFESIRDGIVVVDGDGRIVDVNPAAERVLGVDHRHVGALASAVIPGYGAVTTSDDGNTVETSDDEDTVTTSDGGDTITTTSRRDTVTTSDGGAVTTDYDSTVDTDHDSTVDADHNRTVDADHDSTAVGGVDPGETGGDTTAARGVVEAPTLDEETVTVSLERDGDERFVELARSPITGDEEEGSILIARDVTRQRERVQKIERQNERLDEFAGVVSHDLRNPLSVIAGRADLLGEELEPADQSHVDAIERSATRMEVIIDDLLTLSRAGEQIEEVETVSLARIAGGAWANVQPDGTELDLRVPDRVWIRADRDRLLNVFENLYRNAREHNDPPLTVRVGVITSDSTTADTAPVTGFYVADDGAGIPESDRAEIFDHGYTTNADGTGFGLSIVAAVVEAHGWEVDVTDSAEGGARFEITGVSVGSRPTDSSSPFGGRADDAA